MIMGLLKQMRRRAKRASPAYRRRKTKRDLNKSIRARQPRRHEPRTEHTMAWAGKEAWEKHKEHTDPNCRHCRGVGHFPFLHFAGKPARNPVVKDGKEVSAGTKPDRRPLLCVCVVKSIELEKRLKEDGTQDPSGENRPGPEQFGTTTDPETADAPMVAG